MGYDTRFTGELKFANEINVKELADLWAFFGEDCRDHPEWEPGAHDSGLYYVDLVLLDDFSGIKFDDDTEKTSLCAGMVNMITANMRKSHPDFCLSGELVAQGEDAEDRWRLVMDPDGNARRVEWPRVGQRLTCPHCEEEFIMEGA